MVSHFIVENNLPRIIYKGVHCVLNSALNCLLLRRIDWFCKHLIFNDEKESSGRENTTRILAKTSIKTALTKKTYFAKKN